MKIFINKTLLFSIFILLVFFSCKQTNSDQLNIEKVVSDLTDKFPQLPKGKSKQIDYYKLIRSVKNGEKNFEIQLRSSPDSLEDPQQIIVFVNHLGQCYAIPFFSNTYRDYWDFQFDHPISTVKRTNTTFERELMTALDSLHLNDTIGTGNIVIGEMLLSLLHCANVTESDSTKLFSLYMNINHDIPEESGDSGFARLRKNYKAISSEWHPKEYSSKYNAYWDNNNNRIYQFNNKVKGRRKKLDLSIKVYRQDYVFHSFNLCGTGKY